MRLLMILLCHLGAAVLNDPNVVCFLFIIVFVFVPSGRVSVCLERERESQNIPFQINSLVQVCFYYTRQSHNLAFLCSHDFRITLASQDHLYERINV